MFPRVLTLVPPLPDGESQHSLGVGFLQQGAPELVPLRGLGEHQLVVEGWDAVVNDDVDPVAIAPELKRGKEKQDRGRRMRRYSSTNRRPC